MLAKCAKACVQLAVLLKRSKHSAIHLRDAIGWAWKEERCACEEEAAHGMNEMDFTVLMLV